VNLAVMRISYRDGDMVKESTRNVFKMHGWRVDRAIHNYIYFTFYDAYVVAFLFLGHLLARWASTLKVSGSMFKMVFNRYHAKVLTQEDAAKILTLKEDVDVGPDPTERIIPFPYANQIILREPEFIAVMDCPCRLARENPCEPVDVCMAVGRTTAQFWLEHGQRFHARKITQEEALQKLREGHERGHATTAFFKVATGGRTGVICSYCSCCCGSMEGDRLVKKFKGCEETRMIVPSGYSAAIDREKCAACGDCASLCNFDAISLDDGLVLQNELACAGCGICVEKCEHGARSLVADPAGSLPLDIDLVIEKLG